MSLNVIIVAKWQRFANSDTKKRTLKCQRCHEFDSHINRVVLPQPFPITLDGVKYKHYELDKVHTTVAETGQQVEFTVLVFGVLAIDGA